MNTNYAKLFVEYELNILKTMCRNLMDDIEAGYDYFSTNCVQQRMTIDDRRFIFETEYKKLQQMTDREAQQWCKEYLKHQGAV